MHAPHSGGGEFSTLFFFFPPFLPYTYLSLFHPDCSVLFAPTLTAKASGLLLQTCGRRSHEV